MRLALPIGTGSSPVPQYSADLPDREAQRGLEQRRVDELALAA